MGNVIPLRQDMEGVPPIDEMPDCEIPTVRIHRMLISIMTADKRFTGEDILRMYEEAGSDTPRILELLKDLSLDDARRRALWMIAGYFDEIKWLHVPVEFLPDFELNSREADRTKAYCFHQAYLLSKGMCTEYLNRKDFSGFYNELTNLIIATQNLYELGVIPDSVHTIGSRFVTFLAEATSYRQILADGIKGGYIQRTSAVAALLNQELHQVL